MKYWLAFLVLFAVVVFNHYPTPIQKMQQSTVKVVAKKDEKIIGHCSGVYVGDGRVLTAGHCKKDNADFHIKIYGSDAKYPAQFTKVNQKVGDSYPIKDVALIQTEKLPIHNATISCDPLSVGTAIYVVGHPQNLQWTVTEGTVTTTLPRKENLDGNWLQMDVTIEKGNSGGPVYNRWGEVVGIISHTMVQGRTRMSIINSPHSYAVSSKMICEFLNGNN